MFALRTTVPPGHKFIGPAGVIVAVDVPTVTVRAGEQLEFPQGDSTLTRYVVFIIGETFIEFPVPASV